MQAHLQLHNLAAQALDGQALARVARARAPPLLLQHRLQRLHLRVHNTWLAENPMASMCMLEVHGRARTVSPPKSLP